MPREFSRADRVSAQLRRDAATLVHQAVRDQALPSISVSDVQVNKELEVAVIFITALIPEQGKSAINRLNERAKEFRSELSRKLHIRRMPELRFEYDESLDRAERIEHLLRTERR